MKILITGGCGFIGSHVASRFFKEGHQIYIIDNLSTGNIKNVEVPHKFYCLDIASKKCEDIFRANKFDIVINLSAQVDVNTSILSPYLDSKTNLLGITNMLDLSHKYGVEKFIFASSAAVYGNTDIIPINEEVPINPISPYGMSKSVGEFYCNKWKEIYGLNTICFRFSNVYGPKQGLKGESGVISIFMDKILKGEDITIFGDGNQTRDFLYVEDLVDGIYKAFESDFSGVLNLSTNTEKSLNDLIYLLKKLHPINAIHYKDWREGDIKSSRLDNSKVKKVLAWDTKYSFNEGIEKTLNWYKKYYSESYKSNTQNEKEALSDNSALKASFHKAMPYFENIILILLIAFLNNKFFLDMASIFSAIDLRYIYIILIATMYGMKQGFLSVILSSILYIIEVMNSGADIFTFIYDQKHLLQISFYFIIGAIVGYYIDLLKRKITSKENEIENINEKYNFLQLIYDETRTIKEELQEQITHSKDSFVSIYNATKALDSLKPDEVFLGAVKTVENIMNSSKVSIYLVCKDSNFLRLKSKSNSLEFHLPFSVRLEDYLLINNSIKNKHMFVNKTLNPDYPVMVAPVINKEKVVAIICIHELKFENLTLYYENLFQVLVNLISSSITKAYSYDDAIYEEKYIENTKILKNEEFQIALKNAKENKINSNLDYTLLKVLNSNYSYKDINYRVSKGIRENDILGVGIDKKVYILLANSNIINAEKVISRLLSNDINCEIIKDDFKDV